MFVVLLLKCCFHGLLLSQYKLIELVLIAEKIVSYNSVRKSCTVDGNREKANACTRVQASKQQQTNKHKQKKRKEKHTTAAATTTATASTSTITGEQNTCNTKLRTNTQTNKQTNKQTNITTFTTTATYLHRPWYFDNARRAVRRFVSIIDLL